jgi:outer membrane protein OmpA-like peptidoglycan-associated protein
MCSRPSIRACKLLRIAFLSGLLGGLAACSTSPPVTETEPVVVESPQPDWPPAEAATNSAPPSQAPAAPRHEVAVLDPDNDLTELALHRQALLESSDDALETNEVGYYVDILEARLTQQVRDDSVNITRHGNTFTLLIAGSDAFDSNQSQLKPGVEAALTSIAGVLEEYRNTQISIYGHTDDSGEEAYNQKLSERRALSVARYLMDGGVAAERILVIGYGESRPSAANSTEQDRSRNRRIEMRLEPLAR